MTYTVKAGDTLSKIAAAHGTTVQAIAQANHISTVNLIYVGQVLTIPTSDASSGPYVDPTQFTAEFGNPPPPPGSPKKDYSGLLLLGGVALLVVLATHD